MFENVSIEEAQAKLPEIIGKLIPGNELIITKDNRPVAELRPVSGSNARPQFGCCKGMLTILFDDDEHLDDFKEYMP